MKPGLPPEGDKQTWIGWDKQSNPYILRWNKTMEAWSGVGWDPLKNYQIGFIFLVKDSMKDFIVRHTLPKGVK